MKKTGISAENYLSGTEKTERILSKEKRMGGKTGAKNRHSAKRNWHQLCKKAKAAALRRAAQPGKRSREIQRDPEK